MQSERGAAGLFTEFVPPPMFEIEMCVKPFISHVNLAILMIMPTLKGKLGKIFLSAHSFYLTLTKRSFNRQF